MAIAIDGERARIFDQRQEEIANFLASFHDLVQPLTEAELSKIDGLHDLLGFWQEIFNSIPARMACVAFPKDGRVPWMNEALLSDLGVQLAVARRYLEDLSQVHMVTYPITQLRTLLKGTMRRALSTDFGFLDALMRTEVERLIRSLASRVELFESERSIRSLQTRAEAATTKTEAAAAVASTAAGKTGDDVMSSFYTELAESERADARTFRRLTVTMAFAAVGATTAFILGSSLEWTGLHIPAGDYVHLIQRAIFLAGLFGLAGYFARQSHQHRSMANWAGSLAVQLKTFDAYLAAIENPDVRDELRKTFGARVFGDHPAMKGEPSVTPSAAAMDTAVGWAAKLTAGGK